MANDSTFMGTEHLATRAFRVAFTILGILLVFQYVSLYLSWPKQLLLGVVSVACALVLNRKSQSQAATLALMLISLTATFRYAWWRVDMIIKFFSDESNNRFSIDSVLMLILLSAEVYTILIMVLGFLQTSHPLRRSPISLPPNEDLWPHVDVLIPTYNEPLSLVRFTALAALNIDYPPRRRHPRRLPRLRSESRRRLRHPRTARPCQGWQHQPRPLANGLALRRHLRL